MSIVQFPLGYMMGGFGAVFLTTLKQMEVPEEVFCCLFCLSYSSYHFYTQRATMPLPLPATLYYSGVTNQWIMSNMLLSDPLDVAPSCLKAGKIMSHRYRLTSVIEIMKPAPKVVSCRYTMSKSWRRVVLEEQGEICFGCKGY
ncbi:hypothetical protein XELAEV_18023006mg [Xenopus laevis]|uniref:Uncharacterized protein n=1 Tax=Xenopus laevis TaxID=8355 RepID=A0A974D3B7_XENLA|nr:hypothetical protein XELAEV_18023006mg [Xenopus laevis]